MKEKLSNKEIGKIAESYVEECFRKKGLNLVRLKGEVGADFKTPDNKKYIEVKGTSKKKETDIAFRYITNFEYVKAKECKRNKLGYELHLVVGIGSEDIKHFIIPAKDIISKALPEVSWFIPIRKGDFENYKVV